MCFDLYSQLIVMMIIIFLHMIDCHNNTFLAVRVFDNNMVDHVYTEFFQTGMHACNILQNMLTYFS